MDRGTIMLIVFFIAAVLFIMFEERRMEAKYKRLIKEKIKKNFGINPTEKIRKREGLFNNAEKDGTTIDNITFNDLNLDKVLLKIDHTQSSVGAEYLYNAIRHPNYNKEYHERLKEIRNYFINNTEESKKLAFELAMMGNFKESISDILYNGVDYDNYKSYKMPVLIMGKAIFVAIAIGFFNLYTAVVIFIISLIINAYLMKKMEKAASGVVNKFSNLFNVLNTSKKLEKFDIEVINKELRELAAVNGKLSSLRKYTSVTFGDTTGSSEGDAMAKMIDILFLNVEARFFKACDGVNENLGDLQKLYKLLGSVDFYISLASLYMSNDYCDVEFGENEVLMAKDLKHPLLSDEQVSNSFDFTSEDILLTGSNASGKSTFLRSVGISNVMAFSLGFVYASEYKTGDFLIQSSIDLSDSIEDNVSYFMQESLAIRRMLEPSSIKKILLLDEIFRGTNTIDRISAAYNTLNYLGINSLVIAATHDIELTQLLESFKNYHFEENILENDINFDYLLKKGPATSRNAIEILRVVGYPDEIISGSRQLASNLEREKKARNENLSN